MQSIREGGRDCRAVQWPPADDPELQAIAKQHARDYELDQLDRELGLTEPESGRGLLLAAQTDMRSRGVDPETASVEQMLAAYERVSL